jgi:hypothetical protein
LKKQIILPYLLALASLFSAVEVSNHYRKESKKPSSFLELGRGRHDTTNNLLSVRRFGKTKLTSHIHQPWL